MSMDRWMDKEAVVHVYNGVLLSHKKEHILVSPNKVDILECEVKWALERITMNKTSGYDGIPVELF